MSLCVCVCVGTFLEWPVCLWSVCFFHSSPLLIYVTACTDVQCTVIHQPLEPLSLSLSLFLSLSLSVCLSVSVFPLRGWQWCVGWLLFLSGPRWHPGCECAET